MNPVEHGRNLSGRYGVSKTRARGFLTATRDQPCKLFGGFDTFGRYRNPKFIPSLIISRTIMPLSLSVPSRSAPAINLDSIKLKTEELAKRCIPRTEIIQCDFDTPSAKEVNRCSNHLGRLNERSFRQF